MPCSSRIRTARPSTRRAATSNPSVSKICEPMCECSPASSTPGQASTRRTASSAAPEDSEKPNFWSSCAVATNSWVCASTPVVTRTSTRGRDLAPGPPGPFRCVGPVRAWPRRGAAAGNRRIGQVGQPGDLLERVDHDAAHPRVQRAGQLARQLVAAVQGDHLGRDPRRQRDLQLAAGAHVHAEALLGDPAQHAAAAERLGRVEHPGLRPERLPEAAAALPEVGLVADEQRGAELGGQVAHVQAAEREHAGRPARGRGQIAGCSAFRSWGGVGRVLGGQHVGVARSGGVGDTAHGVFLADRSGVVCCAVLVGGWLARRSGRAGCGTAGELATSGWGRPRPATPGRCRGPSAPLRPATAGPGSRRSRPAPASRVGRGGIEPGCLTGQASCQSKYRPARLLQVGGEHVRLPRRAAPATRSGSQDIASSSACSLGCASRRGWNRSASAPAGRGQRPAAGRTRRERARTGQHRRDCPGAARPAARGSRSGPGGRGDRRLPEPASANRTASSPAYAMASATGPPPCPGARIFLRPGRRPGDLGACCFGQPAGQLGGEALAGVRPVRGAGQPASRGAVTRTPSQGQALRASRAGLGDPDREPGQRVRGDGHGEIAIPGHLMSRSRRAPASAGGPRRARRRSGPGRLPGGGPARTAGWWRSGRGRRRPRTAPAATCPRPGQGDG